MMKDVGQATTSSGRSTKALEDPTAGLVAIMNHRDANPVSTSQTFTALELWTRNNFATLEHHMSTSPDKALPFFHYSDSESSKQLYEHYHSSFYRYLGEYKIESLSKYDGGSPEVRAFIEARNESKKQRTASKWKEMLSSQWMKVIIVRLPEEQQTGDPMKAAAANTSGAPSGTDSAARSANGSAVGSERSTIKPARPAATDSVGERPPRSVRIETAGAIPIRAPRQPDGSGWFT